VAKVEEIIDPISINTNRTIRRWWCWRIRIRMTRYFAAISIHHLLFLLCLRHSNWNGIYNVLCSSFCFSFFFFWRILFFPTLSRNIRFYSSFLSFYRPQEKIINSKK
jgi:hypothetical protein